MVVDLHAITAPHDPAALLASTRASAALYLACGVDPAKSRIFVQSHVPAHSEMAWLLSCVTPVGWLKKMIQFKEKSRRAGGEEVGTGLLTYPVLMAADILLYQSDLVPVGEDQRQHLELARDLAERTNYLFGGKKAKKMGCAHTRLLKVPDAFIPPAGARIMSLLDGAAKMSKSAEAEGSRINLLDPPDVILAKIKRAKTDAGEGLEWDNPARPEARNLMTIYQCVTGMSREAVAAEVGALRWGDFKPRLADAVVAHLRPIQARYAEVQADRAALDAVLEAGAVAAEAEANATLANVRRAMGFPERPGRRAA
jgi:tryptophanyl-tRNA synthetase